MRLLPLAIAGLLLITTFSSFSFADVPPANVSETHIVEQIYILRHDCAFTRTDEWAGAIRELISIGKPAVPTLVWEMDRATSDAELRMLAFTLRGIGDVRAVPALYRALGRTAIGSNDCGMQASDPALNQFMIEHSLDKDPPIDGVALFNFGRAVREINGTLKLMTGHAEAPETIEEEPHSAINGSNSVIQRNRQDAGKLWDVWWQGHHKSLVGDEAMSSLAESEPTSDVIEAVGLMKFGPDFPAGPGVRLGAVHEIFLPLQNMADAQAFLNLETGQQFSGYEGGLDLDHVGQRNWFENNVDAMTNQVGRIGKESSDIVLSSLDVTTWRVENSLWDTIEAAVSSSPSLEPGTRGPSDNFNPKVADNHLGFEPYPITFLYRTRHDARGILQIESASQQPKGLHVRLRVFTGAGLSVTRSFAAPATRPMKELAFSDLHSVELFDKDTRKPNTLDLVTGQPAIVAAEMAQAGMEVVTISGVDKAKKPTGIFGIWSKTVQLKPVSDDCWNKPVAAVEELARREKSSASESGWTLCPEKGHTATAIFRGVDSDVTGIIRVSIDSARNSLRVEYQAVHNGTGVR